MRQYTYVLLALLVACAEGGGTKPTTGAASEPAKSDKPFNKSTTAAAPAPAPAKRDRLEGSALVWKPTTDVATLGAVDRTGLENTKLQIAPVAEGRQNTTLIGENKENPSKIRIMTTNDDVPAFVTQHLSDVISRAGVQVTNSGANRILKSELKGFYVEETDLYKGDVRLVVTLTDESGKTLWSGTTGGRSQRFGRSYKAENYYETLSDSLIEATYYLLRNPSFHEALVVKP